jgi:hypothetical protein
MTPHPPYRTIAVALVFAAINVTACGPGTVPVDQPAMVVLTEQALADLVRQPFNVAADQTRVVLLLSPT